MVKWITASLLLAILIFFHFKGVVYYDEGYILNSALRTANGQIPYKDFDIVYTPLSFFFTSGFLTIFGESVFSGRLAALTISLFSLGALYKLLLYITKQKKIIVLSLLFFISWGPTHSNFPWPVMFAICCSLYTLLFFITGVLQKNKKYFFFAGMATVLVFLSKQNFGVGIFFITLLSLFLAELKNKKLFILYYLFGAGVLSLIFLLTLISTGSLHAFIQNMYIYTFERILVQKALDTPFLYSGTFIEKISKGIFYLSPLIFSTIAVFIIKKTNKKLLALPLFTAIFYLLGIRPTTDYNHLAPLLAFSVLSVVMIITFTKKRILQRSFVVLLFVLTAFGFYTAHLKGYYKWDFYLRDHTFFAKNSRVQVYLTPENAKEINLLTAYVHSKTKPTDTIFVNYFAPLLYFLTDRQNATRYDFMAAKELPLSYQIDARDQLQKQQVKLVIMHAANVNEDSLLGNYIRKTYKRDRQIGNWIIFTLSLDNV